MSTPEAIDIRPLPTDRKAQTVRAVFGDLEAGSSFVLVDDHDPATLRTRLEAKRPEEVRWEYLKKGPHVWHVRVGRLRVAT
jgi:uncharacterized protein (DUF2249 family)